MVKEVLKDTQCNKWLIVGVGKILQAEIKKLCSDNVSSIQRSKDHEVIRLFPWKKVIEEEVTHCPMLFSLLLSCFKKDAKRVNSDMQIVSSIICMLAKRRFSKMSLFQKVISFLLFAGHAGSSVSFAL